MSDRDILPLYFGTNKREIFGWYHPGFNKGTGSHYSMGIVLCNPIGDDYVRAHRPLRHIAEKLASAGFPVLRFDFHGTGDSSGTEIDADRLSCWLQDIDLAIEELRNLSGVTKITLAGLKLGATLALAASEHRDDIENLILWSPYLSGKDFVKDCTQQHKMYKMLDPNAFAMDPIEPNIDGEECLGFVLNHPTINALEELDLLKLNKTSAKNVFITGTGGASGWQDRLADNLKKLSAKVDTHTCVGSDKFLVMINHLASLPEETINAITDWMMSQNDGTQVKKNNPTSSKNLHFQEEAILFGKNRSLFGILHTTTQSQNERPAIVMINAGTVHRIGPHRLYIKMARHWADLGFSVFRLDLSGIGDSVVREGSEENLTYPKTAHEDIDEAFKLLEQMLGVKNFILIGLCSGADITFKTGFKDPRVVGAILMNPLTFCINDSRIVQDADRARYFKDSFSGKEKWFRLLKGQINVFNTIYALFNYVITHVQNTVKIHQKVNQSDDHALKLKETNVPECLRQMAENKVDTLVIATEKDPGIHYVDTHYGEAMNALKEVPGYCRIDLKGTDHTFTSCFAQWVVINTITEHMLRKYL